MGLASIFPKDVVRIDRFLDDALGLKKRERERRGESKEKKKKINARLIVPGRAVDW